MRLKTSHGTYVVAREDGELLHLPDRLAKDFRSVWSEAPPPIPELGWIEAAVTEGPLGPSTMVVLADGFVAFRRDQMYLCADPRFSELQFDRDSVSEWERFAIATADGADVRLAWAGPPVQSPQLGRPVLIETLAGYQILTDATANKVLAVTSLDFSTGPITRYTMTDGSRIVDVDRTSDPDEPFIVYWLYPFNTHIHVWRLDREGRQLLGYDLSDTQAQSFLLGRRALGPDFTARLYMLSQKCGDAGTAALLSGELYGAAEAGSAEALHAILSYPSAYSPASVHGLAARAFHLLCAANRARANEIDGHLKTFMVDALSSTLSRLDPLLGGLSQQQLQAELDFREAFADPQRLPAVNRSLPVTLHHHTDKHLSAMLGGRATIQTLGILLLPRSKTIEFHYVSSPEGVGLRMMGGVRYAYYVLSTNQTVIWAHLAELDSACEAWTIRFEVGDLPTTDEPSVALQRRLGDTRFCLVPDLYYFDHMAFRRRWFDGDSPPWSDKTTRFLWRGSTTGVSELTQDTLWRAPRVRLCELGRAIGPVADFGITDVVQAEPYAESIRRALSDQNLLRERMPQHVMGGAKFLVEIDGNANSWGFFAKLLMGCCVLKVDSPYEQWFYDRLQPGVHYVPIANDLSDLTDKVEWCLSNEDECSKIASAGQRLAEGLEFHAEMARATASFASLARPLRRQPLGTPD